MSTTHQSQLRPADNKFHVGNGDNGKTHRGFHFGAETMKGTQVYKSQRKG
jgi:hypothetical protein